MVGQSPFVSHASCAGSLGVKEERVEVVGIQGGREGRQSGRRDKGRLGDVSEWEGRSPKRTQSRQQRSTGSLFQDSRFLLSQKVERPITVLEVNYQQRLSMATADPNTADPEGHLWPIGPSFTTVL